MMLESTPWQSLFEYQPDTYWMDLGPLSQRAIENVAERDATLQLLQSLPHDLGGQGPSSSSGNFSIVANVTNDRILREGSRVLVTLPFSSAERLMVSGLNKQGRIVEKVVPLKRLSRIRVQWLPPHLRSRSYFKFQTREQAEEQVMALNARLKDFAIGPDSSYSDERDQLHAEIGRYTKLEEEALRHGGPEAASHFAAKRREIEKQLAALSGD